MSSVNKAIIIGNLGQDPEIRTFQSGGRVANLSVATSERWKDRNTGEQRERTEWHRVAVMADGLVGVVERFLKKGSKVYLEGKLETRKWQDQSGQDRYTTEVVIRGFGGTLVMLDGRQDRDSSGYGARDNMSDANRAGYDAQSPGGGPDFDDDIPFGPCVL